MNSLAIRAKSRLCLAYVFSFMIYGSETCPVKDDVIRLTRNDARMVRLVYNVRPVDRISAVELGNRMTLNKMKKHLQNKRLLCFAFLQKE